MTSTSSSTSRARVDTLKKGNSWRRAVELFLSAGGWRTTVRGIGSAGDDIDARRGRLHLSVEAKNHKTFTPSAWLEQAHANAHDGALPVVVAHRRGRSTVEDGYVIMTGATFRALLDQTTPPLF